MYPTTSTQALRQNSNSAAGDIVFWNSGAQAQQLLEDGQVDMALLWSGRAYSAVKNGAKFVPTWDQWMPEVEHDRRAQGRQEPEGLHWR